MLQSGSLDAFVGNLDFAALGFDRAVPANIRRPSYDPRDMLRPYIFGYVNELRSSWKLERECHRNLELMWLLRRLAPTSKPSPTFAVTTDLPSLRRAGHLSCYAVARTCSRVNRSRSTARSSARRQATRKYLAESRSGSANYCLPFQP
ncbi:transposase [Limoniibacter endophyticus]|uniref:transposase n=1 Tax=Limoniibacter endophyticus TaxID=1565040 RepID=UPI00361928EA